MVKNIPTIERSTKIRFGKHANDNQAENTIVFNASNVAISASSSGGVYMTPLRQAGIGGATFMGYDAVTKEVVDTNVLTSLIGGISLDIASLEGNVVSNSSPHFANITTAFTTDHGSNVGISNTSPTHMLSVGDKIFMSNTGSEAIKVEGNIKANKFFAGSSVIIDQNATNKIHVTGTIKTAVLRADNIGISNTSPTHALSLGNEGQLRLNVPTGSIYALETVGNVSAQNYIGDGGLLSNVTLQTVTDKSNVTSNTIHLTNPTTSLKAYSNVIVDGTLNVGSNLYVNDTAANVLDVTGNVNVSNYLKTNKLEVTSLEVDDVTAGTVSSNIVGNNVNVITVTANVVADNVVATNGMYGNIEGSNTINASTISAITINSNVISDNVVATNIGLNSTNSNVLLLGPVSGTTTLVELQPYDADSTKKFLRSNNDGVAWDDVSSTLQAITDGGASTTNEVLFTNGVTSLRASGNVVVSGNVTTGTPIAVTSGGTGLNSVSTGDILYSDASNSLQKLGIGDANQILQVNTDVPGWTSTITGATLSSATITDYIKHTSDTNTYFGFPSNDKFVINTAGSERFRINNLGNIGIGKTSPSSKLDVNGTVTSSTFKSTTLTSGKIPYANNNKELIDGPIGYDSTTNVTSVASNLVVTGNLTVQGGTFFQDSNIHVISDPLIELGNANVIDTIDMGIIMTRPTANVAAGYRGDEKEYTIAYTLSDPHGAHIVPTNATDDGYITANIWGNVISGNVTSTGLIHGGTLKGDGSAITNLDLSHSTHTGLTDLITLGSHTTGNYVQSISGGDGITAGAASEGGTPTVAIDAKTNGGLVIESGKLAVDLQASEITGKLKTGDGGTGLEGLAAGEFLYGSGSDTMSKLPTTNGSGKFLKLTGTTPSWADVSSNLESIVSNGPATANITSNTIQFTNTVNSLTASGNVVVSGNVISTGVITLQSSAGSRQPLRVLNAINVDPNYTSPSHNVLAINRTTGEIYDSGGQGGSTLANIIEEGANVAIGPSAASANLTVNTYGSNVLTVTGNVSADNITIGGLNVAASPFALDDVVSVNAGANVTTNVLTLGGLVTSGNVNTGNVITTGDITVSGNTTSQNIKLTNTDISATISSGTITIDAREKSYGTAPLVISTTDVSNLVFSNLITGAQIVVPILASGGDINISKELTNVNFYAMTTDVSVTQDKHALMTLSNVSGNIYMNAIGFA